MTEPNIHGTPRRGQRSKQLQEELDAAAAIEAELAGDMNDVSEGSPDAQGVTFVRSGQRLFLKASMPYKLHGAHEDSSFFTSALEGFVNPDDDLGEIYDNMREIVLEANFGLAGAAQEKLDELHEQARRTPIRPRQ